MAESRTFQNVLETAAYLNWRATGWSALIGWNDCVPPSFLSVSLSPFSIASDVFLAVFIHVIAVHFVLDDSRASPVK